MMLYTVVIRDAFLEAVAVKNGKNIHDSPKRI
jgi:hypothetical protein